MIDNKSGAPKVSRYPSHKKGPKERTFDRAAKTNWIINNLRLVEVAAEREGLVIASAF